MSSDGIDSSDSSSTIAPIILLLLCILFVVCINCIIKCCKDNCSENPNTYSHNHALRNQQLIPNSHRLDEQQHSSNLDYQRNQSNRSRTPRNQTAIDSHRELLIEGTTEVVAPSLASPVVVPPYPVEPRHPTPHTSGPLPAGFAVNQPPYPTHTPVGMPGPYPPTTTTTPYPPTVPTYPVGSHLGSTPYPPTADSSLPPSYQEAVGQTGPPPPQREVYSKQAPYNPNY